MAQIRSKQPNTALLRARRRRGFERKQVSWLLGHSGPQVIAQYERGQKLPSIQNAIRLSLIYGCDLEEMFPENFRIARAAIAEKSASHRLIARNRIPGLLRNINKCTYEDDLNDPSNAADRRGEIRDHITRLAKALAQL
jgi:DNA-binding XRE family transcriptional regulator